MYLIKNKAVKIVASVVLFLFSFSMAAQNAGAGTTAAAKPAQAPPPTQNLKKPGDELRSCSNRNQLTRRKDRKEREGKVMKSQSGLLSGAALLDAPEDEDYLKEMERLLVIELENMKQTVADTQGKHEKYAMIFPEEKNYQELVLEELDQTFKAGQLVSINKTIAINYTPNGDVDCIILDYMTRNLTNDNLWTRKIIRLFSPDLHYMELETHSFNYKLTTFLERTSPWIQLKAMRTINREMRTNIYMMDRHMLDRLERQRKVIGWQIDF